MTARLFVVLTLVLASAIVLSADYLEVRRSVTLKTDPAGNAEGLEQLDSGVNLELLNSGAQTNGYYYARNPQSGEEGWVYRTFVRRFAGQLPGSITPQPQPQPSAAGNGTWFQFDQDFVAKHFANDLAFSSITFDGTWVASSKHSSSCGGKDGEIHIGAYETDIEFAANERPFSRVVDEPTVAWESSQSPQMQPPTIQRFSRSLREPVRPLLAICECGMRATTMTKGHPNQTGQAIRTMSSKSIQHGTWRRMMKKRKTTIFVPLPR